jgi:hypothetical protein
LSARHYRPPPSSTHHHVSQQYVRLRRMRSTSNQCDDQCRSFLH